MPEIGVGVMIFAGMEHMWLTIIRRLKGSSSSQEEVDLPMQQEAERIWKAAGTYKDQAFKPDVEAGWARFKEDGASRRQRGLVKPEQRTPFCGESWKKRTPETFPSGGSFF